MVRSGLILFILLMVLASGSRAQDFDVFARVRVSPREVVVREPFRVTISVHTATWYTEPLRFSNLKIEKAFIIPFTRTLSSMEIIQGKKYASLTFYYLVIPYESGLLELPSMEITATTPPVGDYKGVAIPVRTRSQRIQVSELPTGKEDAVWMVAKNVSYSESWDRNLDEVKVGDVLERRIVLNAAGTLPSLIQPLDLEKPPGVSLYPGSPELKDLRDNRDVNGRRSESYSYLLEEEGDIEIPETVISWWNPAAERVYQRIIPGRTLQVAPNPDLELMISLKDSLDALQAESLPLEEQAPFPWKKYGLYLLAGLLSLFVGIWSARKLWLWGRMRRLRYLESSRHYLRLCRRELQRGDARAFTNALYTWLDHKRQPGQPSSLSPYLEAEDRRVFQQFMTSLDSGDTVIEKDGRKQLGILLHSLSRL